MITQKGRFLIRHEEMDSDYLERFDFEKLEEKYQEIKAFYLFEGDLPIVRVYFIYSPEEFLFLTGRKFESWMSATVGDHSTINIFAPSMIEKYTTHKKESIFRTIAHELSHLFYGHSKFVNLPLFNEGIAEYHGDNHCDNKINFKLPTLIGGKDQKYDYGVGHLLVCSIMEYFREQGNIKLIQFLKQITKDMKENDIFELFKQNFGKDPDSLIKLKGVKKMELETVVIVESEVLESLKGAQILAGTQYDLKDDTYDPSCFYDTCDCVCNQPCHGEGPCYSLL